MSVAGEQRFTRQDFALATSPNHQSPPSEATPEDPHRVPPARKRQHAATKSRADVAYPRKRATTACQLCRARKIKCNNARPSCSSCSAANVNCVYGDSHDQSAFDPASIAILNRIDLVLSRLDHLDPRLDARYSFNASPATAQNSHSPEPQDSIATANAIPDFPESRTRADAVLQWSIFGNRYPPDHLTNDIYCDENVDESLDSREPGISARQTSTLPRAGVDEEAIPHLIRSFFDLVHTKNPVLDIATVWKYANHATEAGFGWDPPSCLILLACALGSVATPMGNNSSESRSQSALENDASRLQAGEAYYNLARKRFGFLDSGIIVPQCYFLAGVYLMYTMRPLLAWSHFQQASRSFHLYLHCAARRRIHRADSEAGDQLRSQEQRLYWSCYKSECELRVELDLPHSSLASLDYPDMHPSPPDMSAAEQEQSWFYYLTEITLRRIGNRIIDTIYANDYRLWHEGSLPAMVKTAEDFVGQLQTWYAGIPEPIRFCKESFDAEELPYMIQGRFLHLELLVCHPFVHYAIHNPLHGPLQPAVLSLAQRALSICLLFSHDENAYHRHHGTWLYVRGSISSVLTIIACAVSPAMQTPTNWKESVYAHVERLRYWSSEGPGIAHAVRTIEEILSSSLCQFV